MLFLPELTGPWLDVPGDRVTYKNGVTVSIERPGENKLPILELYNADGIMTLRKYDDGVNRRVEHFDEYGDFEHSHQDNSDGTVERKVKGVTSMSTVRITSGPVDTQVLTEWEDDRLVRIEHLDGNCLKHRDPNAGPAEIRWEDEVGAFTERYFIHGDEVAKPDEKVKVDLQASAPESKFSKNDVMDWVAENGIAALTKLMSGATSSVIGIEECIRHEAQTEAV